MRKVFSLILALCLLAVLQPMGALADEPAVPQIRCFNGPDSKEFSITPSATPSYIVSKGDKTFEKWTSAEAPTDNYVKFELIAGTPNVVKATFKNFNVDNVAAGGYNNHTIEFTEADYDVEIEWLGENSMVHGKSASIKCSNNGKVTITGAGSMYMDQNEQAIAPLWIWGGDLLIKNTTLSIKVYPEGSPNSSHHGILSSKGNVTLESCKITSNTMGGSLVWLGVYEPKRSRFDVTDDVNRIITVKGCEITVQIHNGAVFASAAPAVISNTTMKVTKTHTGSHALFEPAPTFAGEHTAIGGLAKNANDFSKMKPYQPSKLGSYSFFYLVPGIQELIPTEPTTAPTEPEVTVPETTVPEITVPETNPQVTQPTTQPATQPNATEPNATQPNATQPADTTNDGEEGGNPLVTVVIVIGVLIVLAGGGVAALVILKKKGIIK